MNNQQYFDIKKIHTTELGIERIKKNLRLEVSDVVKWCQEKIQNEKSIITRKGKNWYINIDDFILTINAYSLTIITAHKIKK